MADLQTIYVYDCYGLDVNAARGPHGYVDVISRDPTAPLRGNIVRRKVNGVEIYPAPRKLFDSFGNIVLGINADGSLFVREPSLPLALDKFNRPKKLLDVYRGSLTGAPRIPPAPPVTPPTDDTASTLSAASNLDGLSATITVHALDGAGAPAPGKSITLIDDVPTGSTVLPPSGTTDVDGAVSFVVSSGTLGLHTYTAQNTSDGAVLTQAVRVFYAVLEPVAVAGGTGFMLSGWWSGGAAFGSISPASILEFPFYWLYGTHNQVVLGLMGVGVGGMGIFSSVTVGSVELVSSSVSNWSFSTVDVNGDNPAQWVWEADFGGGDLPTASTPVLFILPT